MPVHAVVCLKRVLDPEISAHRFRINDANKDAEVPDAPHGMGPYDENALEVALVVKDRMPGVRVTALTYGPTSSEEILRKALSTGADDAVRVDGPQTSRDPLFVAEVLAAAIRRMGDVGLVLVGLESGDWDSGQTGFALAEHLSAMSVSLVGSVTAQSDDRFSVRRVLESAEEDVKAQAPVVVSVTSDGKNTLRMAKVKDILAAKRKPITTVAVSDLSISPAERVLVEGVRLAETAVKQCEFVTGASGAEQGRALAQRLRELGLV